MNTPLTIKQILDGLEKKAENNSFAADLLKGYEKKGFFSEKQSYWAEKLAREVLFPEAQAGENLGGDFKKLISKFETAKENGLKRPALTFQLENIGKTKIYPAKADGRNPGMLYVNCKEKDLYFGKISPDGILTKGKDCNETVIKFLKEISKNPVKFSAMHGREIGCCCFCAKDLTTKNSKKVGYGPVCANKWGLPWGE